MPWGSNHTFLVHLDAGEGKHLRAIYKPRDGERPLYDYPRGTLYKREHATFLFSRALGWPDIPYTLIREGPYGVGSMQLYIDCDPEITYFNMIDDWEDDLRKFSVFDVVVNNGDRKAGHCLLGEDDRIWSIDHGLTFHTMFKLRTVMLEFWGEPIPKPLLKDLESVLQMLETPAHALNYQLGELLAPQEIQTLMKRLEIVIENPTLPRLDPYRNVPWPWV